MDARENRIADLFAGFEREQDTDLLYTALNEVEDVHRDAPAEDREACKHGLWLLLNFMTALDKHIDPKWDPKKVPPRRASPPAGVDLPDTVNSQVDPASISDPVIRAQYEQDLQTTRENRQRYNVQFELRGIEERAIDDLKLFAEACFTGSSAERREFQALVDASSLTDARKKSVRKAARGRLWPFGN